MARTPPAPPAPDADTGDDAAPAGASDTGDGDYEAGPTVLLTVMDNHDGTYELIRGDEDAEEGEDEGEGEGTAAGAGAEPEGAPEPGEGAEGGPKEGETFDSPGALLKGILDIVKEAEANETGDGGEDENFAEGFAGGSAASPPKPTMAAKF